ncbi:Four-helix bundle copper-binding protein OS=Streptomyces microflavus OX=1919 GN=Smic_08060 PE=4 SV=1 [Streptomyces microflavus]
MVGELAKCIRTYADCADICTATAAVLSRHTGYDANVTTARSSRRAPRSARRAATNADGTRTMHEHCRVCAEACRSCETACTALLGALG